ncbi:MAG TPA: Holliday junction branch migration DNA helicase RuvB [Thermoanaerobaculia bacterium]|nr:Holliday junction branch migration DNA helicase RuvB [Thermoanaerobaculia bacterium]HUM29175.1 Holliday junction branch migration DNA helicase RuvB [Thermoanaerobaculia bacterium]HXK67553.1 Holliday junction branch migration DNA helicase RuvB [Thermoanaerobaculia bacterium]
MDKDLLASGRLRDEEVWERTVRPRSLDDFIGQNDIKKNLSVFIQAALKRNETLDHVLFSGPPGLGKTTLAHIIALEMNTTLRLVAGPSVEKAGDLAAILTNLEKGGVLFIDEIHRLHPAVEEILYPAMEDFRLDVIIGQGPAARTMKINLPPFTLVGATTRSGLITSPLHSRFGIVNRLNYYDTEPLTMIVNRTARILGVDLDPDAAIEIAKRGRGTPRIANRLFRRVRDFADVEGEGVVTLSITRTALTSMSVDEFGLDDLDRKIITIIMDRFDGGPVGLKSIAASLGEDPSTLEDVYEPFLVQAGFLARTPRGRVVTPLAYQHLGVKVPPGSQGTLGT